MKTLLEVGTDTVHEPLVEAVIEWEAELREHAASVCHDVRRPLAAAAAFAEILADGVSGALNEEQLDHVATIRRNLAVLETRIADLHELALAASGGLRLELESVELEALCVRVQDALAERARERDVRLYLDSAGPMVLDATDRARLERLLSRLVERALDESKPRSDVGILLRATDRDAVLEVVDECGYRGSERRELVRPFATGSDDHAGSGLGIELHVCHAVATAHGGTLDVARRPAGGRSWIVRIPMRTPSTSDDASPGYG